MVWVLMEIALSEINKCVINLPERTDRYSHFVEFEGLHLFEKRTIIRRIDGIKDKEPMNGIAQAHMSCILLAKSSGWPCVLIMEDDCYFQGKEKTLPYVTEAFKNIPEDWDILLGGISESNSIRPVNEYWNITKQFCGTHFYIVHERVYDQLLAWPGDVHFDRWVNFHNDKKCYVTKKLFAIQRDGYSDNVKAKMNYSDKFRRFELLGSTNKR